MKLLVIEDDPKTSLLMQKGLTAEGFSVDVCHDGEQGLETALAQNYDLIVLDVMLPKMDGWSVISRLRERDTRMPVLMVTARDAVDQRVYGLSLGADDYIVKPFAFTELVARIRTVLRRAPAVGDVLQFEDLRVDIARHKAQRADQQLDLSNKEMLLLALLLRRRGEILTRSYIAEQIWDMKGDSDSNVVDVNIRRIRAKVDDPHSRKLIQTVRGRGYVLR
ncbi:MAG: heavy metal response regulator transcription factor [Hyphomicrobiaceae bacterium]|nr:heavy metal response regulator transcription factor [Hyphomicrobiaceae bacterium]